jgi:hypothetical protein
MLIKKEWVTFSHNLSMNAEITIFYVVAAKKNICYNHDTYVWDAGENQPFQTTSTFVLHANKSSSEATHSSRTKLLKTPEDMEMNTILITPF